jgi:hypothetical protein
VLLLHSGWLPLMLLVATGACALAAWHTMHSCKPCQHSITACDGDVLISI